MQRNVSEYLEGAIRQDGLLVEEDILRLNGVLRQLRRSDQCKGELSRVDGVVLRPHVCVRAVHHGERVLRDPHPGEDRVQQVNL